MIYLNEKQQAELLMQIGVLMDMADRSKEKNAAIKVNAASEKIKQILLPKTVE